MSKRRKGTFRTRCPQPSLEVSTDRHPSSPERDRKFLKYRYKLSLLMSVGRRHEDETGPATTLGAQFNNLLTHVVFSQGSWRRSRWTRWLVTKALGVLIEVMFEKTSWLTDSTFSFFIMAAAAVTGSDRIALLRVVWHLRSGIW